MAHSRIQDSVESTRSRTCYRCIEQSSLNKINTMAVLVLVLVLVLALPHTHEYVARVQDQQEREKRGRRKGR